jgi:hypothetical protein
MSRPLPVRPLVMGHIGIVRCPCGKVVGTSLKDAKRLRKRATSLGDREANQVRYYQCPESGAWHWTRDTRPR